MNPQTIKAKLVSRGIRQAELARSIDVTRQCVNKTIRGVMRSDKIERTVSAAIGLPRERVFPKSTRK